MAWARLVLKQPAGGSREVEPATAADLHARLDHVPADTGEAALEAAHVTVLDTAANRSQDSDRSTTADRGSGERIGSASSDSASTSDPTSRGPDPNGPRDLSKGEAGA
jgi:2-keto-3-deoxygluconate permease